MFLEIEKVNTFYDVFQAVFDVSFYLEKNQVVCLLGRNGAGKSTTMTSIVGLNVPKSGSVRFKGAELKGRRPYEIARMGMGFVPENRWIFGGLTVKENLELGCRHKTKREASSALERIYLLFPPLEALSSRVGGTLSGGEQQMLTIARALMGEPEVLLLDEVTIGLAPIVVHTLKRQTEVLKSEGLTMLLTEQNALFALDVSDRAYVIDKGAIVYGGSVQSLRENHDLMTGCLGV